MLPRGRHGTCLHQSMPTQKDWMVVVLVTLWLAATAGQPADVDLVITPEDLSCDESKSACDWSQSWAMRDRQWNGTLLSYSSTNTSHASDCCALCRSTLECVFYDFNTKTQSCNLYDLSPFYNPFGLVESTGYSASFIDWKAVQGFTWDTHSVLPVYEGFSSIAMDYEGCAASCISVCNCSMWCNNINKNPTCSIFPTPDEIDGSLYQSGLYPTMVPNEDGKAGSVFGQLLATVGGSLSNPVLLDWENARVVNTSTLRKQNLTATMPWVSAGGTFDTAFLRMWYSWIVEAPQLRSNSGRSLYITINDFDALNATVPNDIINTTLGYNNNKKDMVLSLQFNDTDYFSLHPSLALDQPFTTKQHAMVTLDVEFVELDIDFSVEIQVSTSSPCTDGGYDGFLDASVNATQRCQDRISGPASKVSGEGLEELKKACEELVSSAGRRRLLSGNALDFLAPTPPGSTPAQPPSDASAPSQGGAPPPPSSSTSDPPPPTSSVSDIQVLVNGLVPLERLADREGLCGVHFVDQNAGLVTLKGVLRLVMPVRAENVTVINPEPGVCVSDPCARGCATNHFLDQQWYFQGENYSAGPPLKQQGMPDIATCCEQCKALDRCMFFSYQKTNLTCFFYSVDAMSLFNGEDASGLLANNQAFKAAFLDERTYEGMQWLGVYAWTTFLANMPNYNDRVGPVTCSAMCQSQCGCSRWSFDRSSSECRMYPQLTVSSAGVNALATESGWVAGIKIGPSLSFSLDGVDLEWQQATVDREPYLQTMTTDICNAHRTSTNVSDVTHSLSYEWKMKTTLFQGLWKDVVPLNFDGFLSMEEFSKSPLLQRSVLVKAPWDQTFYSAGVDANVSLPAELAPVTIDQLSRTLINTTLQLVDITVPFRANFTVHQCSLETLKDPTSSILGDRLTMLDLLLRGSFCGTVLSYSPGDVSTAIQAVVQVEGNVTFKGLPLSVVDVQTEDDVSEGQRVLVGYDLPGTVYNTSLCRYSDNGWMGCEKMCLEDPLCVGWTWLMDTSAALDNPVYDTCGANSCAIKYRIQPMVQADGLVSGVVPPPGVTDRTPPCSVLADTMLTAVGGVPLSGSPSYAASSFQCCRLCKQSAGCIAFNYNYTGSCSLLSGTISGATPTIGMTAGLPTQDSPSVGVCTPSVVLIPAGGSLIQALEELPASSQTASWQEVCCFNNLPNCFNMMNPTAVLLPCVGEQLQSNCTAVVDTPTAAMTINGCACKAQYNYTDTAGRVYSSSGGCLTVENRQNRQWCFVDASGCDVSGLLLDDVTGEYSGVCMPEKSGAAGLASTGGEAEGNSRNTIGCNLVYGMAFSALGSINNGSETFAASAGSCCQLCQITDTCTAFTFINDSIVGGRCWLLNSINGGTSNSNAVSGISNTIPAATTDWRRRSLLQSTASFPSCPSVYPLANGESIQDIPSNITNGATWQQICCFNGVTSCGVQPVGTSVLIPCDNVPDTCAIVSQETNIVVVGSDNTLAVTLGVGFGCGMFFLLASFGGSFLIFTRQGKIRQTSSKRYKEAGIEGQLLLSSAGSCMEDDSGRQIAESPAMQDSKYVPDGHPVKGDGGCVVMYCHNKEASTPVAVKFYSNSFDYYHEKELYELQVTNTYIPYVYDFFDCVERASGWPAIAMERGDYSLQQWMARKRRRASEITLQAVLRDILEAVATLHNSGVVHGNICPSNIVWFGDAHRWKLVGFNNWSRVGEMHRQNGALRYKPPEVATAKEAGKKLAVSSAADMWSVGVVLWELSLSEPLFGDEYSDREVRGMLSGDLPMPFQQYRALWNAIGDKELRELLQSLLSPEPTLRKSASEALASEVFETSLDPEMQERLVAQLARDVSGIHKQVTELQEIQMQVLRNTTINALVVCITFEELKYNTHDTGKADLLDNLDSEEYFDDAQSTGWEDVMTTKDSFFSASPGGHSRSSSFNHSRANSALFRRNSSRAFLGSSSRSDATVGGAQPEDLDVLHKYASYLSGKFSAEEAPISLSSSLSPSEGGSPMFLLRSDSCYAIRFKVMYGGKLAGEVPIETLDAVYLSHPDDMLPDLTLPCQAIEEECNSNVWEGFCILETNKMMRGVRNLAMELMFKLKVNSVPLSVKKSVMVEVHPKNASLVVQKMLPKLRDLWADAPEWLKLSVKGLGAFYNMGL